ncbi:interference hedgehog-like Protein [Elysia marginata]|uniref:Interference hedgehog-like Protein n=1 Tax=Elysia marginata TaxID=1093978 RepID=A0AAV4HJQ1_9GAST|nr:interference hedgehog-like Protein [Elysia marginata]
MEILNLIPRSLFGLASRNLINVEPARLKNMDFSKPKKDEEKERSENIHPREQNSTTICKRFCLREIVQNFPNAAVTSTVENNRDLTVSLPHSQTESVCEVIQFPVVATLITEIKGLPNYEQEFFSKLEVTDDAILKIALATKGQQQNKAWMEARKGRLTASNFGFVLSAKRVTPALIQRVLGAKQTEVAAMAWGTTHEKDAIHCFTAKTGLNVEETGVWLDKCGFLGASPDGLVGHDCVLEVKCPYSHRDHTIEDCLKDPKFYLTKSDTSGLSIKTSHNYWHQVQGQIHLTGRVFCFFVVWTKRDLCILKIQKDNTWAANLNILRQFYKKHMFPQLVS